MLFLTSDAAKPLRIAITLLPTVAGEVKPLRLHQGRNKNAEGAACFVILEAPSEMGLASRGVWCRPLGISGEMALA